ncbi:MAG: peptide-methionine (S)-S-oxide reductase [Halomonadaceae bacterium T82-2]|nr:MAG: peptide-methionine (S)-S-oxide reductase [Halomonadaceae bacterium T82-2]
MRLAILTLLLVMAAGVLPAQAGETRTATFAGGCFWCVEEAFDQVEGVISTTSGYTGGDQRHPTYKQVSAGGTGHAEAVEVAYDPQRVDYATLLRAFWHNIDPFAENRQFCDAGNQYRSAIFYHDERQKQLAEQSRAALAKRFERPIATQIVPARDFWKAETYHQDYYRKNPIRYHFYKAGCGREARLKEIWGDQAGRPGE